MFFMSLCVPIIIFQILGVDPIFMMWDTSFLDDPLSSYDVSDLNSYRDIQLHTTIFTSVEDLHYVIGQGRPAGLTYNNNVLSVFVILAIAINLMPRKFYKLKFSDFLVNLCVVLTMSKLALVSTIVIYIISLIILSNKYTSLIIKQIFIFFTFLFIYFLIFPGIFLSNLSIGMIVPSILIRLNSFLYAVNSQDLYNFFHLIQLEYISTNIDNGISNTFFSDLAYSGLSFFFLPFFVAIAFLYKKGMILLGGDNSKIYLLLLIACVLTQFGVSFYIASSFQLILGCALYPLFYYFKDSKILASYK